MEGVASRRWAAFRMGWSKWSGEEPRALCPGGRIRSRAFAPADVPCSASERPNSGNRNAEDPYTQARMQLDGHAPLHMSWPFPKAHIAPKMLEYGGTTGSHVQRGMGMTGGRMPRTSAPRRPSRSRHALSREGTIHAISIAATRRRAWANGAHAGLPADEAAWAIQLGLL